MDDSVKEKAKQSNILLDIILIFLNIIEYALIGIKACTYDLIKKIFKKNTHKKYKYNKRTMAKLEKNYQELVKDLETDGATRNKEAKTYLYKVRDINGKIVKGTMSGYSKLDINAFLVNEGYSVFSIKTSPIINLLYKDVFGSQKMSNKELIFFLTQLSTYLKSGININDAVKILSKQVSRKKNRKKAFQSISYELTLGSSFSSALEKQGNLFPAFLINMIKSAEASGTLEETLEDMSKYYTEVFETNKQMKSAMIYPLIISVFSLFVIVFILVFIIPKFVDIYNKNDLVLSGFTKFIIDVSHFFQTNYLKIGLILLIVIILIYLLYKYVKEFRKDIQSIIMHLPVIKDIIIYNEIAILSKTFATLLKNNVFITDSIDMLSRITNNEIYKDILNNTIENIIKGEKISAAFKDHWAVPDVAYFMIVTGESTGELAKMMEKVGAYYQGLHKNIVNNLKTLLEPILISFLAIIVGGIILAVIIPMFSMYEQII